MNSFNVPLYHPSEGEIKAVTEEEGSFYVDKLEAFDTDWDPFHESENEYRAAQNVANSIRSITEPILTAHFGGTLIMEYLFGKFADALANHLCSFPFQFSTLNILGKPFVV